MSLWQTCLDLGRGGKGRLWLCWPPTARLFTVSPVGWQAPRDAGPALLHCQGQEEGEGDDQGPPLLPTVLLQVLGLLQRGNWCSYQGTRHRGWGTGAPGSVAGPWQYSRPASLGRRLHSERALARVLLSGMSCLPVEKAKEPFSGPPPPRVIQARAGSCSLRGLVGRTSKDTAGCQASGVHRAGAGTFESRGLHLITPPMWLEGGLGRTELI